MEILLACNFTGLMQGASLCVCVRQHIVCSMFAGYLWLAGKTQVAATIAGREGLPKSCGATALFHLVILQGRNNWRDRSLRAENKNIYIWTELGGTTYI